MQVVLCRYRSVDYEIFTETTGRQEKREKMDHSRVLTHLKWACLGLFRRGEGGASQNIKQIVFTPPASTIPSSPPRVLPGTY